MTKLEKQLIAMMAHGIWIEFHSGHRYIRCMENNEHSDGDTYNGYNFHDQLKKHNIMINNKIYGGVKEAIVIIDEVFELMHGYTLEVFFNSEINEVWDVKNTNTDYKNRITYSTNHGGLH